MDDLARRRARVEAVIVRAMQVQRDLDARAEQGRLSAERYEYERQVAVERAMQDLGFSTIPPQPPRPPTPP